ncbi:HU family DNA-binding protein [Apilactobacillus timberlakei]|uniref:HU family DNA-binding protein n=1 Tax=Apilactobacillus timberlakei TaxID=2008380 RepID=UPI00112DB12E|nr:HU family DNA-binding protein [Apilactobacillus timberlakei]TPR16751.1 HU family DNA-binding protein [Apilactobacillus timberlakei]TPR21514.1 HU family DNA-binding protein [Apilactobacillus timberlakei]
METNNVINKDDLINLVYKELNQKGNKIQKNDISKVTDSIFSNISKSIKYSEKVRIFNFGVFESKNVKARYYKNLGQKFLSKEHLNAKFRPSNNLKKYLNE